MNNLNITTLRMERQHLTHKANENEYIELYRDMQPGQNVYWNGFGDPPSLTYRAAFNDIEFNRDRQRNHSLIKGRFAGGNLGWIIPEDLELFAIAFAKPLDRPTPRHITLLELIEREPLTIQQMKEETGMLVKEITPILHRLQEAFLVYEDQYDGEWDRGWYMFTDMFTDVDLIKYSRSDALKIILKRLAYRNVCFDVMMAKSFYKLPEKDIKTAVSSLVADGILMESEGGYVLCTDDELLRAYTAELPKFVYALSQASLAGRAAVYAMHRNDFLVKSNEHWLKDRYPHSYPDTLYYLLIDGEFHGAAVGKFRYTPEVEDVILDLSQDEAAARKGEILQAVHLLCGASNPVKRYQGENV